MHLRIGTRRSPLAMAQTHHIMGLIREKFPQAEFTLCQIATIADRDRRFGGEAKPGRNLVQGLDLGLAAKNRQADMAG